MPVSLLSSRLRLGRATVVAVGLTAVVAVAVPALPPGVSQAGDTSASAFHEAGEPLIFGHRGASGYRPEHTLASYDLAIRMGADVIEPDLVSTKDHQLVVRHENEISGTTDVAQHPEFAALQTTKTVDGIALTGWFTEDFTLAELRTLRAVERLPLTRQENTTFNGRYQIPTLQEVLDLADQASRTSRREIGVAPETKHPTYFDSIGLSLEEPLLAALEGSRLNERKARVWVQSFEEANLRDLRAQGLRTPVVQLTSAGLDTRPYDHVVTGDPETYAQMTTTAAGLAAIATYATVLGPDKTQVLPRDLAQTQLPPTPLVADAHRAGLEVVPYTFRAENEFLPLQYRSGPDLTAFGDLVAEIDDAFAAGVDGVFTDQPDIGFAAREDLYGRSGLGGPQGEVP